MKYVAEDLPVDLSKFSMPFALSQMICQSFPTYVWYIHTPYLFYKYFIYAIQIHLHNYMAVYSTCVTIAAFNVIPYIIIVCRMYSKKRATTK